MLEQTVLLPSSLLCTLGSSTSQENHYFFNSVISLLRDLGDGNFVLVDRAGIVRKDISSAVAQWPQKFRKKAEVLVKRLRFAPAPAGSYELSHRYSCRHCAAIARALLPRAVFLPDWCCGCVREQVPAEVEVIDAAYYQVSDVCDVLRNHERTLRDGEWTQQQLEEKMLTPLFVFAKHVKLYDRMIGRSTQTNATKRKERGEKPSISPGYQLTLEWIIDVFARASSGKQVRSLEIYTAIDSRRFSDGGSSSDGAPEEQARCDARAVDDAVCALREFESVQKTKHGDWLQLRIKEETHGHGMPHDRYLATDQVCLQIGRGFDLFWTDARMVKENLDPCTDPRPVRDVVIHYCPNAGDIEKGFRCLPDLRIGTGASRELTKKRSV